MPNKPAAKNNPFKGKKSGKWTKWGGYVHGLVKSNNDTWFCQSCGVESRSELKPFLFEIYPGDFVRLCNICYATALKDKLGVNEEDNVIILRRTITLERHDRGY